MAASLAAGGPDSDLRNSASFPGAQDMSTYMVSFGFPNDANPAQCAGVLEEAAQAGNGVCLPASNRTELNEQLNKIVSVIVRRAQNYSNAAVNAFGLSSREGAIVTRFLPNPGSQWIGRLFRFEFVNEGSVNSDLKLRWRPARRYFGRCRWGGSSHRKRTGSSWSNAIARIAL